MEETKQLSESIRASKKAFTLIELLVVIAIIAILAAILFPVFAQAKASAKKISSVSNLKQIGLAEMMYANEYDDHAMVGIDSNGTAGQYTTWFDWLQPYVKNQQLGVSPGYSGPKPMTNMWLSNPPTSGTYLLTYQVNGMIVGNWASYGEINGNLSAIPTPARTIYIAESPGNLPFFTSDWEGCSTFLSFRGQDFNVQQFPNQQTDVAPWIVSSAGGNVMAITANVPMVAVDGHAKSMTQFNNFKGVRKTTTYNGKNVTAEDPGGGWNGMWCQPPDWPTSWNTGQ
jgi:prepilin-type N-terminal cleavage/methylation domain-containing protein